MFDALLSTFVNYLYESLLLSSLSFTYGYIFFFLIVRIGGFREYKLLALYFLAFSKNFFIDITF